MTSAATDTTLNPESMEKHFTALRKLAVSRSALTPATRSEPTTYQEYVCAVDEFVALLDIPNLKKELPKLATSQQAVSKYLQFLNELLEEWDRWKGDVHPGFDNACKKATDANGKLPEKFTKAIFYLEKLIRKDDPDTRDALLTVVDSMQTLVDGVAEHVEDLTSNLLKFILGFDRQKELFAELCKLVLKDQGVKQDTIDALQKTIDRFNAAIAADKRAIIGLSIADGIAVILGAASIVGAFFTGGLTLLAFFALGPAIGIASYYIDKYRKEIGDFEKEIANLEKQQGTIGDEIKALIGYKSQFEHLTKEGSKVKTYVREVKKPWDALAEDLRKIRAEIDITDDPNAFKEYLEAFREAETIWKSFMTDIQKLRLPERKVAKLPANMKFDSQADIERILRESVGIDEYFRRGRA